MRKKAVCVVIVAVTLGSVAVLYRTLQPNTYRVEDILAVYQENADYGDVPILSNEVADELDVVIMV